MIANCAGRGARELVPDPSVRPVRGQQVIVDNPGLEEPNGGGQRAELAERLEAFIDRRVLRYWTLVGIVNGWAGTGLHEGQHPDGDSEAAIG